MFERHVKYLKDNPKGYWFKAKLYGWGWTPATWQGWLVLVLFIGLLLWNGFSVSENSAVTETELTWFFVRLIVIVLILLAVCWKTGEKPRWQWGPPDEKNKH